MMTNPSFHVWIGGLEDEINTFSPYKQQTWVSFFTLLYFRGIKYKSSILKFKLFEYSMLTY